MWHNLAQGEQKLKLQSSLPSSLHHYFPPFHTTLSFTPYHFCSGQGGLETDTANVKSAVGPQTIMISHDAGSESSHPASQHSLVYLNLCSTETHGESLPFSEIPNRGYLVIVSDIMIKDHGKFMTMLYDFLQILWDDDRDVWWHEEMEDADPSCYPVWVSAEDPLFMLYTRWITMLNNYV